MRSLFIFAIFALSAYFASAQNTTDCDDVDNCNARGTCDTYDSGDWYCICDDGYTTHPSIAEGDETTDSSFCNYEQKKQLTAFLLAWFLGYFGGGQWYIEDSGMAAGKLVCGILFCCCVPCFIACAKAKMGDDASIIKFVGCFQCCCILGLFVWWLVDLVNFGTNSYADGNGVDLASW